MSGDSLYTTPDGATIAYELAGRGRPVGYAHGVLLSRAAVRGLELFDIDAVAAGRRLLTYDQRGHGHSSGRAVAEDYRFERAATDLPGLLDAAAAIMRPQTSPAHPWVRRPCCMPPWPRRSGSADWHC